MQHREMRNRNHCFDLYRFLLVVPQHLVRLQVRRPVVAHTRTRPVPVARTMAKICDGKLRFDAKAGEHTVWQRSPTEGYLGGVRLGAR